MNQEFLMIIFTAIGAGLTKGIDWFFNRKKVKTEVDSSELDNVEKAITIWRKVAEDMEASMNKLELKIDTLTANNLKLQQEVSKLETKVQTLTRENKKLLQKLNREEA